MIYFSKHLSKTYLLINSYSKLHTPKQFNNQQFNQLLNPQIHQSINTNSSQSISQDNYSHQANTSIQNQPNLPKKITLQLSQNSNLYSIIKKRKTSKQRILQTRFFRQWLISFIISFFFVIGGHMYFPETFLSKNFFFENEYEITRKAEQQVLSGKHGVPKVENKTL